MSRFANTVALISGGARGMGASHARALVAEGAKVSSATSWPTRARPWPRSSAPP